VKFIEAGSSPDGTLHFYVMEYLEGVKPLKKFFETDSPFKGNALKSLSIYIGFLEALQACQKVNVVHRDLSPGNVLITPDHEGVKLIDFGCCFLHDGDCITLSDEAVGTPCYRAPECEDGTGREPTIKADLYSAGKILWSLVTNKKAPGGERAFFDQKSLTKVLPNDWATWHLHLIFENTIRRRPDARYPDVATALAHARDVRERIEGGYLPLEMVVAGKYRCPLCGHDKALNHTNQFPSVARHAVMGPPPSYLTCSNCGYTCIMFGDIAVSNMDERRRLEQ
jgi:serine/threonine protein kinase